MAPREIQLEYLEQDSCVLCAVQMCVAYTAVMWLDIITPVYNTMGQRVVWAMIIVSLLLSCGSHAVPCLMSVLPAILPGRTPAVMVVVRRGAPGVQRYTTKCLSIACDKKV